MLSFLATFDVTPADVAIETLFQCYPDANTPVQILAADICIRGSTPATYPITFDWVIQTGAGTSNPLTAQLQDRGLDDTPTPTLLYDFSGAEPGGTTQLAVMYFHSQGSFQWRPPLPLIAQGGVRVGLRYLSTNTREKPTTVTVYMRQ